ncbi:MAG: CAP domain-containing protein [Bacteriovoracia bacterium]
MKYTILLLILLASCKDQASSVPDLVFIGPVTPAQDTPAPTPSETIPVEIKKSWAEEFMELVNAHRTSLGLRSLVNSPDLETIALKHSKDMALGIVAFGHTGFSGRCTEGRLALGGGNWCSENVAMGQNSPQAVFNSWMNSSGHRANIESSRGSHTGLGYYKGASGKYYWTQIFLQL